MNILQCLRLTHLPVVFALIALSATVTLAQQPAARPDRGFTTGASYSVSDIENISLTNGNLNVSIPLAGLPPMAGGKLNLAVNATYNSKLWNVTRSQEDYQDNQWQPYTIDQPQLSALGGWSIGGSYSIEIREVFQDSNYLVPPPNSGVPEWDRQLMMLGWFKVVLRTPDGAERELRPTGYSAYNGTQDFLRGWFNVTPTGSSYLRYYSFDGTYVTALIKSETDWTLFMPDGTQVVQTPDGIQRVKDTNGNNIKIFSDANGTHYQDEQTTREIRVTYDPAANSGAGQSQVHYQTVGGDWMIVAINWGTTRIQGKAYATNSWLPFGGELGEGAPCKYHQLLQAIDIPVVREIVFPVTESGQAARRYTFSYNSDTTESVTLENFKASCSEPLTTLNVTQSIGWGALSEVITPSGAKAIYSYSLDSDEVATRLNADAITEESVTQKQLIHDSPSVTDSWTYNISGGSGSMVSPDGSSISEVAYPQSRLVYRSIRPGVVTERHWTTLVFSGGVTDSPGGNVSFNPVVDAEYTTINNPAGQPAKMSAKTFQHDYNGNVTLVTEYDWFDPSLVSRDAQGVPTGVPGSATVLRTSSTSYHNSASSAASGNGYAVRSVTSGVPSIINAAQDVSVSPAVTRFSYDGQSFGVAPTAGNLTSKSVWDDLDNKWITTSNTFGLYGNVATATDARGKVTQLFYDDGTHALPNRVVADPQNGTGTQTTTTAYDYYTGLVISVTDPNNKTSTISYVNQLLGTVDPFGRPGIMIGPDLGSGVNHTVKTIYEDNARTVTTYSDFNAEGDGLLKSQAISDMLGRTIETRQYESATAFVAVRKSYDAQNRISRTSNPFRAGESVVWTTTLTDALGRMVSVTTPDNGVVASAYDVNFTTVTDQAGRVRRSMTDALGRLLRIDEPDNSGNLGSTSSPTQATSYDYDVLGNLRHVYQGTQTRTFTYDSLSRLRTAQNPESGTITYAYDDNGNLLLKTDARGVSSHYDYDSLNRVTRRWYNSSNALTATTHNSPALPSGVGATEEVKYFYDSQALPGGAPTFDRGFAAGRLVATTYGGSAGDYYGFDASGRAKLKIQQTGAINYQTTANYNLAGAVTSMSYPSGRTITNSYDNAGRLTAFTGYLGDGTQRTYATGISYSSFGAIKWEQYGTATALYHKSFYNIRGQMFDTRVSSVNDTWDWNRGRLINYYSGNHQWGGSGTDNNGNVKFQEMWIPPPNATLDQAQYLIEHTYDYDSLNRLQSVNEQTRDIAGGGSWTPRFAQVYNYDRYGNRTINQTNTWGVAKPNFGVNTATNQLTAPTGYSMSYDAAGTLTNDTFTGEGARTYDAENKMTGAQASLPASYVYDGDGRRIKRIVNGTETWQVYGIGGELLAEYAANASHLSPQKEYGYRNGELLVTAEAGSGQSQGGEQNVVWTNAVGVTVSGNSLAKTAATAWGNAGAVSTQTIGSGDGYVETTVSQLHTARIFGFSQADVDQNYSSVEFGLHLEDSSNTIYVIEFGTVRGTFGTYAVGDKMRVSIESGVVKYKKNGATFYTSTVTPNYPLLVDTALYSNGATLTGVVMASSAQNVSWTNTVGVTASGSNLTKTAAAGWGNAGAVSNQTITSGDGYVETTVGQTGNARIFGFSDSDADQNYTSVDFGLHMEDNNPNLWVYESGTSRGVVGTYAVGDKLRVTIEGGVVKYRKNGALLHTSTVTPTYPLLVDTALHTNGATLSNVVFGNGSGGSSANVKWLVNDHLGTPRMIFDQTGSLANVSRHDYLPFGEELTAGTGGRTIAQGYSASDGIRQKFTGYEADGETGLNFAQARYHSPTQGRFTSPDPMLSSGQPAEPQSWNRYGYVLNNPLVFTDPSGLIWGYQDGTNANGERVRTFQWFDGDQVDEGWSAYHSDRYVGRDEVLVLASNDFMRIARSNFSEEEYASLLQAQGADCTAFNDEQRSVINREVGKEVGRGWRFGVQKGVAGIFGAGLAGGASSALNFTFGASARQASRLPPVLFHYTDEASAGLIQGSQLGRPGGQLFLTNNGGLTPLQAQLELSLPAQNSARALFAVDSQVLNTTNLLRSGRVTGNVFGRPGGGFEFQFRSGTTVPQGSFTPFRIGP